MDKNFLKTKINLDKKKKAKTDIMLKLFILFFIAVNAMFFLSDYFMPKIYKNDNPTPIGIKMDMDNYIATICRFSYDKKADEFEIILEIDNLTAEPVLPKILVKKRTRALSSELKKSINDRYYIYRVKSVPNVFSDIDMELRLADELKVIKMTDKTMQKVNTIKDRKPAEYIRYAIEGKINGINEYIANLEKQNKKLQEEMSVVNDKMNALIKESSKAGDDEKIILDKNQSKLANRYNEIKNKIEGNLKEIRALQEKVKTEENRLKNMRK